MEQKLLVRARTLYAKGHRLGAVLSDDNRFLAGKRRAVNAGASAQKAQGHSAALAYVAVYLRGNRRALLDFNACSADAECHAVFSPGRVDYRGTFAQLRADALVFVKENLRHRVLAKLHFVSVDKVDGGFAKLAGVQSVSVVNRRVLDKARPQGAVDEFSLRGLVLERDCGDWRLVHAAHRHKV